MLYRGVFIVLVCFSAHICKHSCVRTYSPYLSSSSPSKRASLLHFHHRNIIKDLKWSVCEAAPKPKPSRQLQQEQEQVLGSYGKLGKQMQNLLILAPLIKTMARLCRVYFSHSSVPPQEPVDTSLMTANQRKVSCSHKVSVEH